jgi:hypothetical protein
MLRRANWNKFTNVSKMPTAFIFRAIALHTCHRKNLNSYSVKICLWLCVLPKSTEAETYLTVITGLLVPIFACGVNVHIVPSSLKIANWHSHKLKTTPFYKKKTARGIWSEGLIKFNKMKISTNQEIGTTCISVWKQHYKTRWLL